MTSRSIIPLAIILMLFIASCDDSPTGSRIIIEPDSKDQLIPLARGNFWRYRDLSGRGGARPEGEFVIHSVDAVRDGYPFYRDRENGSGRTGSGIPLVFYLAGGKAWGVTFDGIFVGYPQDDRNIEVYTAIPKNPSRGEAYAGMRCVRIEEVITPAGTFECYQFDRHDQRASYWWARGVGLVRYRTTDSLGIESGNWVLESYKVQ